MKSTNHEIRNTKWFDVPFGSELRAELLTILSEVEGQIQMAKIQNPKQSVLDI